MVRTVLRPLAAAVLAGVALYSAAISAEPVSHTPHDISFNVARAGAPMGSHKISFRRDGDDLMVEIAIDLEVRLAFIPVFRYTHRNSERWRDGRLVRLETTTDDDGVRHKVVAQATEQGLRVTDSAGRSYVAPADTIPTSYWNPQTVTRGELLNTQDGRMMPIRVESQRDSFASLGEADHYRLVMLNDKDGTPIDVWYDKDSLTWVKLAFEARGSKISYALASIGRQAQQAAR
jgi:hypothetical protein